MDFIARIKSIFKKEAPQQDGHTSEAGTFPEDQSGKRNPYLAFQIDHEQSSVLADIDKMDKEDGRVKRIHSKIARDATRGGLHFSRKTGEKNLRLVDEAKGFVKRCDLNKRKKVKGHARFLVKDGEIFLQWIVDDSLNVIGVRRLPAATIRPNVDKTGTFRSLDRAYLQYDPMTNKEIAAFAFWQITHTALDNNPDDPGDRGRPWLDASRVTWKKLTMTEEDLVIRRRTRAPQRRLHILEGATDEELAAYEKKDSDTLAHPMKVNSDYYSNKKGSIQTLEGDANLDQIKDVQELKDDFFAGTGIHKHLFGYAGNINRDIYEDTLEAYYEILEEIQETLADGYEEGLRLQFLLRGINADGHEWDLKFKGRKVESDNQRSDRMLKHQAMGIPDEMVWEQLGYSVEKVLAARQRSVKRDDPYQDRLNQETNGNGKITNVQGNARKKESAVSIGN